MRAIAAFPLLLALAACGPNDTHPTTTHNPYVAGSEVPLSCVPNLDGKLEAAEMPVALGATVTYLVSPAAQQRPVDVAGKVDGAGHRLWDWSRPDSTDQAATIGPSTLTGRWYAAQFPEGAFVAPVDAAAKTEGVYRRTDAALELLGIASAKPDPAEGKTLLVYDRPIALYRFPLEPGAEWVSSATTSNAMLRGLPYAGRDTYEVKVDAAGHLALPDLEFTQALRVRFKITIAPAAGAAIVQRQISFVSECFGEVARATSRLDEPADDFTTAAEVRRLGLEGT
jgi:hypothetical protein